MEQSSCYILIDLGGTNVRLAAVDTLKSLTSITAQQFVLSHDFARDFAQLIESITDQAKGRPVTAIGLAVPGLPNAGKTALLKAHNIPEWVAQPFVAKLSTQFNCPVFFDNDAVVTALGEILYGSRGVTNFMVAIWGTGIGGAAVQSGPPLRLKKIDYHKYLAALEDRCGGHALAKQFGKPAADLTDEQWTAVITDFLTSIKIVAVSLGQTRIVCVGGVALKQRERIMHLVPQVFKDESVKFELTQLGSAKNFALYGAAALIQQKFKQ